MRGNDGGAGRRERGGGPGRPSSLPMQAIRLKLEYMAWISSVRAAAPRPACLRDVGQGDRGGRAAPYPKEGGVSESPPRFQKSFLNEKFLEFDNTTNALDNDFLFNSTRILINLPGTIFRLHYLKSISLCISFSCGCFFANLLKI